VCVCVNIEAGWLSAFLKHRSALVVDYEDEVSCLSRIIRTSK
jgi:hypothetical protein